MSERLSAEYVRDAATSSAVLRAMEDYCDAPRMTVETFLRSLWKRGYEVRLIDGTVSE